METLSKIACSAWLARFSVPAAPYGSAQSEQFPLPPEAARSASVVRQILTASRPFGSALLQFTDWPLYHPDKMAVLVAVRASHGEYARLIDTPGHLFSSSEIDLLTGMFSLAIYYQWSAYLYFDHCVVFHCWEGDLLDCWIPKLAQLEVVREIFAAHQLASTLKRTYRSD